MGDGFDGRRDPRGILMIDGEEQCGHAGLNVQALASGGSRLAKIAKNPSNALAEPKAIHAKHKEQRKRKTPCNGVRRTTDRT